MNLQTTEYICVENGFAETCLDLEMIFHWRVTFVPRLFIHCFERQWIMIGFAWFVCRSTVCADGIVCVWSEHRSWSSSLSQKNCKISKIWYRSRPLPNGKMNIKLSRAEPEADFLWNWAWNSDFMKILTRSAHFAVADLQFCVRSDKLLTSKSKFLKSRTRSSCKSKVVPTDLLQ